MKKVITKSSRLSVKASSAPATSAGRMCGKSTSLNACQSLAPRSLAASSSSWLKLARRDRTTHVTNGKQKVLWALVIANRLSGHERRSEERSEGKEGVSQW